MALRFQALHLILAALLLGGSVSLFGEDVDTTFQSGLPQEQLFGDLTSRFRVSQWKVEQGLPQNCITCLHQSSEGYLWFGTIFGLARYDGVRFTIFEKSTLPVMQLTDDHVLGITEAEDKTLWVCTKRGLLHHKDHQWQGYASSGDVLKGQDPAGVTPARMGGVWVGTQGQILRFDDSGLRESYRTPFPGVRSIRMLQEDESGRLWYADRYRVMRWDRSTGESKMIFDCSTRSGWVRYLKRQQAGVIEFGGLFGAYQTEGDSLRMIAGLRAEGTTLITNEIQSIVHLENNEAWVIEDGRLLRIRKQTSSETPEEVIGMHKHPALLSVDCLLKDTESNLWAGTREDGLHLLQERRFTTLQLSTNWIDNDIWSVCEDKAGTLWIGTSHDVFQLKNQHIRRMHNPRGPGTYGLPYSLWPDNDGSLWVGYGGSGLFRLQDNRWQPIFPKVVDRFNVYRELNVRSIYQDRKGVVWFGMLDGLHRLAGDQHSLVLSNTGPAGLDIRAIHEDSHGAMWLGSYGSGLLKLQDGQTHRYTRKEGLCDMEVTCIVEDEDGALWVGTGSGLSRFKNGSFRTLTRQEGLLDNVVNWILIDSLDNLWISCNRGIYRVARKDANAVADGLEPSLTSTPFGESDGMLSAETNGGSQPSGWKSRDGALWFPTTKGLVRIDPLHIQSNLKTPRVVIEQVSANGQVRHGDGMSPRSRVEAEAARSTVAPPPQDRLGPVDLLLGAGEARVIEIRYTATSFEESSKVRFQYQLAGHDRKWTDAGDRRVTHYTNLDPGDYQFLIRACNNHGVWGNIDRTLRFKLAPHFYQTWWFFLLCAGLVLAIVSVVQAVRLRIQRRILQFEKQNALERERSRIAKDMHDDLGARLTHLGLVSELVESPEFSPSRQEGGGLPKISALARDAVRSLDEIVWAVSPKKNSLDQLAGYLAQTAQDMIMPSGLSFDLQMPSHIPCIPLTTELRHNVFLVCKEALNNAIKHSGGARIRLTLSYDLEGGSLAISDDGHGFHPHEAEGQGNGLANMRKRAESVQARFSLESAPLQGTRIEICFPFDTAAS